MIELRRAPGGLTISGHAGYAPPGRDIVCAGVSALVQSFLQSVAELTGDALRYELSPGFVQIRYGKLSEPSRVLLASLLIGMRMLSEAYPQYIRIDQALKS
jgi:uncharacterized protein YsxB (DUF464 family)